MLGRILELFADPNSTDVVELTGTWQPPQASQPQDYIYVQHGRGVDYSKDTIDQPVSNEVSVLDLIDSHNKGGGS
jgi:hypothetical protein